jgi:hypothetical protein
MVGLVRRRFSEVYAELNREGEQCPIESGRLLRLADNECEHGHLPQDRVITCSCWER